MVFEKSTYVVSYGHVFFEQFVPGTLAGLGERYLGHATALSVTRDLTTVDRIQAVYGVKSILDTYVVDEQESFVCTLDSIDRENVAMWFGAETQQNHQTNDPTITETMVVRKGLHYQIGKSVNPLLGMRNIEYATFSISGVTIPMNTNVSVDTESGRFRVLVDAPDIDDGDTVTVKFQPREASRYVASSEPVLLEGALRFVSRAIAGPKRNLYFPRVNIGPDRSFDQIAESAWQTLSFSGTAIRLNPLTKLSYSDEYADVSYTYDETVVIDDGGISLEQFKIYENMFDRIVNVEMPSDFGIGE